MIYPAFKHMKIRGRFFGHLRVVRVPWFPWHAYLSLWHLFPNTPHVENVVLLERK